MSLSMQVRNYMCVLYLVPELFEFDDQEQPTVNLKIVGLLLRNRVFYLHQPRP